MTDVNISRNLSYGTTTPSHSTTSVSQAISLQTAADQVDASVAEYSKIGPTYETIDSGRKQPARSTQRNPSSSRLSERYEFSTAHLTATAIDHDVGGDDGARGEQGEVDLGMNYEVPLNLRQHEEYILSSAALTCSYEVYNKYNYLYYCTL
jgi:hypothetical protein